MGEGSFIDRIFGKKQAIIEPLKPPLDEQAQHFKDNLTSRMTEEGIARANGENNTGATSSEVAKSRILNESAQNNLGETSEQNKAFQIREALKQNQ